MTSNGEAQAVRASAFSQSGRDPWRRRIRKWCVTHVDPEASCRYGCDWRRPGTFEGENSIHVSKRNFEASARENFHDFSGSDVLDQSADPVGKQAGEMIREHHKDISKEKIRQEVLELFRKVRIPEPEKRYNRYPHESSGGMRQRVMIAMALANKTEA